MARLPSTKDCVIPGCTFAAYKAGLCKSHWLSVPYVERMVATVAIMDAQARATERQHGRLRRIAREIAATPIGKVS